MKISVLYVLLISMFFVQSVQAQTILLFRRDLYVGDDPQSVALGDLNGDGRPDLVTANYSSNKVFVRLNRTYGINSYPDFTKVFYFSTGTGPQSVAIGDLDGDEKAELVTANYTSSTVSVLWNKAIPITFTPVFTREDYYKIPSRFITIGDLTGDGKPDLAIAYNDYKAVIVLPSINTSYNRPVDFPTLIGFSTGTGPQSIAIGDLNGDGRLDMVTANYSSNTVSVLYNTTIKGTPLFASFETVDYNTGNGPQSVAIGDFNGDGRPDLAAANYISNTVSVFLNKTAPGDSIPVFTDRTDFSTGTSPASVAIGDLDGDGKPDLAVANYNSNTVSVLFNTTDPDSSTPGFTEMTDYTAGIHPVSIAVGDMNGDGRPDLVTANSGYSSASGFGSVSVLMNFSSLGMPSDVAQTGQPWTTELLQNYPNPFNPSTSIRFTLEKESDVKLKVYDLTGREVNELVNSKMTKGPHVVYWDGTNDKRHRVSSGVYLYQLMVDGQVVSSRKMNLLK